MIDTKTEDVLLFDERNNYFVNDNEDIYTEIASFFKEQENNYKQGYQDGFNSGYLHVTGNEYDSEENFEPDSIDYDSNEYAEGYDEGFLAGKDAGYNDKYYY